MSASYNEKVERSTVSLWPANEQTSAESERSSMQSVQPLKPIISAGLSFVALALLVFINGDPNSFLVSGLQYTPAQADAFKWTLVIVVGIFWLLVQVFLEAPAESSRLSLALTGSILWLGLMLFFHFSDPSYGGTVAFFALVGGLLVVISWTHYLADEF